jgi:hypothetical protein
LGDGVRVLIRLMKQLRGAAGTAVAKVRDCTRSLRRRILAVSQASRDKTEKGKGKLKDAYKKLLAMTTRVMHQADRFSVAAAAQIKLARGTRRRHLQKAHGQMVEMTARLQQVLRQTRQRVLQGNTHAAGKLVSVFEPATEVIRKVRQKNSWVDSGSGSLPSE